MSCGPGVLDQVVHSVTVTCRANAIPDSIRIDVSALHLGDAVHVRELVLPEGVTLSADPDLLILHVVTRAAEVEPEAAEGETSVQPVVIKPERKEKEE